MEQTRILTRAAALRSLLARVTGHTCYLSDGVLEKWAERLFFKKKVYYPRLVDKKMREAFVYLRRIVEIESLTCLDALQAYLDELEEQSAEFVRTAACGDILERIRQEEAFRSVNTLEFTANKAKLARATYCLQV